MAALVTTMQSAGLDPNAGKARYEFTTLVCVFPCTEFSTDRSSSSSPTIRPSLPKTCFRPSISTLLSSKTLRTWRRARRRKARSRAARRAKKAASKSQAWSPSPHQAPIVVDSTCPSRLQVQSFASTRALLRWKTSQSYFLTWGSTLTKRETSWTQVIGLLKLEVRVGNALWECLVSRRLRGK